jgi:hypothetical protein
LRNNTKKLNRKTSRIIGSIALILAFIFLGIVKQGCAEHTNPFDPESSTGGEPFKLKAKTGYGRILLEWNWPTYPADGGARIQFDSFLVVRQNPDGQVDTVYQGLETAFEDNVPGEIPYIYQVAGFRGDSQSDASAPASASAYPLPLLNPVFFGATDFDSSGYIFSPLRSIAFINAYKFILSGKSLKVYRPDDNEDIECTKSLPDDDGDMVIVNFSNEVYIFVSSPSYDRIDVFLWENNCLERKDPIETISNPKSLTADPDGNRVYIVDDESQKIYEINLDGLTVNPTDMKTGKDPKRLIALSQPPLLFSANEDESTVSINDLSTKSHLLDIMVDQLPQDLWVGPDANLYVACAGDGTVKIIDPYNREIINTLEIYNPVIKKEKNKKVLLSPRSVTGFDDPRHNGVLIVLACTGEMCSEPVFVLFYSIGENNNDWKFERYMQLPQAGNQIRINQQEDRLYALIKNKIWISEF